jgi:hypothetical protein
MLALEYENGVNNVNDVNIFVMAWKLDRDKFM